ncbi:hypothetical protein ACWDZ4_16675 [Streptomyces sp. NPDC003016]
MRRCRVARGTAACTSGGGEPADKARRTVGAPCENGTYAWFNADKRDVLTGVAEKQEIGKGDGRLAHRLTPLHTPRVAVTFEKGPQAGAEAALRSLGARIGETDAADRDGDEFAHVRRPVPDLDAGSAGVDGAGTFVDFARVRQVTADFRYTCGDTASRWRAGRPAGSSTAQAAWSAPNRWGT